MDWVALLASVDGALRYWYNPNRWAASVIQVWPA